MAEPCTECARMIEVCAFCEDAGCEASVCERCLRYALGEAIPPLHEHGG